MSSAYISEIVKEIRDTNGLLVLGAGLGLAETLLAYLQDMNSHTAVLLINTPPNVEHKLIELNRESVHAPLLMRSITASDIGVAARRKYYALGGVLFVTSRTVVLDLLLGHLPAHLIAALIVLQAENLRESSNAAFAIREFRRQNALSGFVLGVSEKVETIVQGFSSVEKLMRMLQASKLLIWPRIRDFVKQVLEARPAEVVLVSQTLSELMLRVQQCVLKLIAMCVNEVRRANLQTTTLKEMTIEDVISNRLEQAIKREIVPKWYSIGAKTKRLISDVRWLKRLLALLCQVDCVEFYRHWQHCLEGQPSWALQDEAQQLERAARQRVFLGQQPNEQLLLEPPPKWATLTELLAEIDETERASKLPAAATLVVCANKRAANQLRRMLTSDAEAAMKLSWAAYRRYRQERQLRMAAEAREKVGERERHRRRVGGGRHFRRPAATSDASGGASASSAAASVSEVSADASATADEESKDWARAQFDNPSSLATVSTKPQSAAAKTVDLSAEEQAQMFAAHFRVLAQPQVVVTSVDDVDALQLHKPRYIVLMQPDVVFVRAIERYKAAAPPATPVRFYYMVYADSVEKALHDRQLRDEQAAFRALVDAKSKMVIPTSYVDVAASNTIDLTSKNPFSRANQSSAASASSTSTLIGGLANSSGMPKAAESVIVDTREFRSALPSMLHRDNLLIKPATLLVGDYILSPKICVERKSVPDLAASLSSGHLYAQAAAMCRLYERPVLLIEFVEREAFGLEAPELLAAEVSGSNIQSKLTLLTLHFPSLCVLLSRSPRDTAKLFRRLKEGQEQPDANAATVAAQEASIANENEDVCLALPGITPQNYPRVVEQCKNLVELVSKSREQLKAILGSKTNADKLHEFLHAQKKISQL